MKELYIMTNNINLKNEQKIYSKINVHFNELYKHIYKSYLCYIEVGRDPSNL